MILFGFYLCTNIVTLIESQRIKELLITATRERVDDEMTPAKADHSKTGKKPSYNYDAGKAIDMDLGTSSNTVPGSDGTTWLKVTLDKVHCVRQVIRYKNDGTHYKTWTCTETDCSKCEGTRCHKYTLTVSTKEDVSDLSPVSDCKYGDTVKSEKDDGDKMVVNEIAIVEKPGNLDRNSMTELDKLSIS